jgi:hypothetical protein
MNLTLLDECGNGLLEKRSINGIARIAKE